MVELVPTNPARALPILLQLVTPATHLTMDHIIILLFWELQNVNSWLHQQWCFPCLLGFLWLSPNTMTKTQVGGKGFIWLIIPYCFSLFKEVRTVTQIVQNLRGRNWCRCHGLQLSHKLSFLFALFETSYLSVSLAVL